VIHKTFRIPNGYSTKEKTSTLDIERVLNVLLSRKRKKYILAHRKNYEPFAELKSEIWQCPYCNYEVSTTILASRKRKMIDQVHLKHHITKDAIKKWGTQQISLFGPESENLVLNDMPVISGEIICPKCRRKSFPSTSEREVHILTSECKLQVKVELCDIREIFEISWLKEASITINFPTYECVTFDFNTGATYLELKTLDDRCIAKQNITAQPDVFKTTVVYHLMNDYTSIYRITKRMFTELFGEEIPFSKAEFSPEKYILMTQFVGYPRNFYDAIPYVRGTYCIEKSFEDISKKLSNSTNAIALFEETIIPKYKSIKRIIFNNPGLLFYVNECEQLWKLTNNANYYCLLMQSEKIFNILSLLHQRPILFDFLFDFSRFKSVKNTVSLLINGWHEYPEYAIDYCTLSKQMKHEERKKWKKCKIKQYGFKDDEDEDLYEFEDDGALYQSQRKELLFSVPMKVPHKTIRDCIIDDFSFCWLRNGNEYYLVGKTLKNCLISWSSTNNPVVVVRKEGKAVAAIEVGIKGVHQALGYRNTGINRICGLSEAYKKWLKKYQLKELTFFEDNDLPF